MKNAMFMEQFNIKQAFEPVDLNTAALTGARIGLKGGEKVIFLLSMNDGTGSTVTATLKQHNAASSGTTKALTTIKPWFYKKGTETAFTKVQPTVASDVIDASTQFAADQGILVIEVSATELDVTNDFNYFSVNLADGAAAKIGDGLYILGDCKFLPSYSQDL